MDILTIESLALKAFLGTNAWEQEIPQTILCTVSFPIENATIAERDDLSLATDYSQMASLLQSWCDENRFALIETCIEAMAKLLIQQFKLSQITLTLSKPHAIPNAKSVGVTITRMSVV